MDKKDMINHYNLNQEDFLINPLLVLCYTCYRLEHGGENCHIPLFGKNISNIPLFVKYLAIYHFFEIRIYET